MRNSVKQSIEALAVLVLLMGPATAAEFVPLGDLPGGNFDSRVSSVSDDGSVVVGYSDDSSGGVEAFRWTEATGMVGLGRLNFPLSIATDTSADGSVVTGYLTGSGLRRSFRWTEAEGMEIIGPGRTFAVSADGSIILGEDDSRGAYVWTRETGLELLSSWPGGRQWSSGRGISDDNSILLVDDFRWEPPNEPVRIEQLEGRYSGLLPLGMSADGSVIVGEMGNTVGLPNRSEAFRWTEETGTVALGDLPGGPFRSSAYGVSGDGSIVVGYANLQDGFIGGDAFIWDAANGMRKLQDVLIQQYDLGSSLEGWTLHHAASISADGNVIVGYGTNPNGDTEAWRVDLATAAAPEPSGMVLGLLAPTVVLMSSRRLAYRRAGSCDRRIRPGNSRRGR